MALHTSTQKVLVSVEADTGDARDNLKALKRETESATKSMMASLRETVGSIGAMDGAFERLKRGFGDVTSMFGKVSGALRGYAADQKLFAATASFDIERIQRATKGLRTETELMTQVSQLNRGEQKLTQQQMELLTTAIAGFERKGLDGAKALDIVRQATVQLSTDGLKEMGIHVDKTGLSMDKQADRAKLLDRVLQALTKTSREFAAAQLTAGDEAQRSAVKLEDTIDKLQRNVRKGAAASVSFVDSASKAFMQNMVGDLDAIDRQFAALEQRLALFASARRTGRIGQLMSSGQIVAADRLKAGNREDLAEGELARLIAQTLGPSLAPLANAPANANAPKIAPPKIGGGGTAAATRNVQQALAQLSQVLAADVAAATPSIAAGGLGALAPSGGVFGDDVTNRFFQEESSRRYAGMGVDSEAARAQLELQGQLAKSIIGTVDATQLAAQAFGAFSTAAGDAFFNALTGAESFGAGMKKAFGAAIGGASKSMFVSAIQETALGLASLALGPFGGVSAAAHFKAAAAFGSGAVVAGVIAGQLGVGGSTGAAPGAGGRGAGSASSVAGRDQMPRGSGGQREIVYVVGDPFDTETNPRRRQNSAKRLMRQVGRQPTGGQY